MKNCVVWCSFLMIRFWQIMVEKNMQHRLQQFQTFLLRWHQLYGRHTLPWRQTIDPYHILVSELMLQQTQVSRVIPKYLIFLQRFPSLQELADAELADLLIAWQGLGYNRRARYLWELARVVVGQYGGQMPTEENLLRQLPGLGPYTTAAIMAFAYNQPVALIETNVRTVYLYHFFSAQQTISDQDLMTLIAASVPSDHARDWYAALMDYGSYLKSVVPNPSRKSKHHTRQSTFVGSVRQVRGEIIRLLAEAQVLAKPAVSTDMLKSQLTSNKQHFEEALAQLVADKLIIQSGDRWHLSKHT